MTVVTNAGPLMALAKIGALSVLTDVHPGCLMPEAVYEEVVTAGLKAGKPDASLVDREVTAGRLVVVSVAESSLPAPIGSLPLDRGERQAIHVAIARHAGLVLLDDSRARSIAAAFGLQVKGTLGIIVEGLRAGVLQSDEAIQLLGAVNARPDIWIADSVCDTVLASIRSSGG